MSPDAVCEVAVAALAEAGYPGAVVLHDPSEDRYFFMEDLSMMVPPVEVVWRASTLLDSITATPTPCWPCYEADPHGDLRDCDHDWRTEPWPDMPERVG